MISSAKKLVISILGLSFVSLQACAPSVSQNAAMDQSANMSLDQKAVIEISDAASADMAEDRIASDSTIEIDNAAAADELSAEADDVSTKEYELAWAEPAPEVVVADSVEATTANDSFASSDNVSDADLDRTRGAFNPDVLNKNVLDAISQGNSSVGSVNGANTIGAEAFSNTSGLVNLIQNSGNNVIIQSSTIVNLTLQ